MKNKKTKNSNVPKLITLIVFLLFYALWDFGNFTINTEGL